MFVLTFWTSPSKSGDFGEALIEAVAVEVTEEPQGFLMVATFDCPGKMTRALRLVGKSRRDAIVDSWEAAIEAKERDDSYRRALGA